MKSIQLQRSTGNLIYTYNFMYMYNIVKNLRLSKEFEQLLENLVHIIHPVYKIPRMI